LVRALGHSFANVGFQDLDLDIPLMIWMNGMTCPDADTRYRLLDEFDRPRRPPRVCTGYRV